MSLRRRRGNVDADYALGAGAEPNAKRGASGYFAQYNRHKLGVSLDLKHADDKALLLEMIRKADVVAENFRPGTMAKLGLGYATLQAENPRLVYTAVSGFGHSGPHSPRSSAADSASSSTSRSMTPS